MTKPSELTTPYPSYQAGDIGTIHRPGSSESYKVDRAEFQVFLNVEDGATADQTGAEMVSSLDTELGHTDWKVDRSISDSVGADTHSVAGTYTPNCADGAYRDLTLSAEITQLNAPTGLAAEAKVCTLMVTASGGNQQITAIDTLNIGYDGQLPIIITDGETVLLSLINVGSGWVLIGGGVTASEILDSTAAGRTLLTAADATAQRAALNVEYGATNNRLDLNIYSSGSWTLVNGSVTVVEGALTALTLPLIVGDPQRVLVCNRHSSAITVDVSSSDLIQKKDGTTASTIDVPAAESLGFFADAAADSTWRVA